MIRELLIVEDRPGGTEALAAFLVKQGHGVRLAPDFATAFCMAEAMPPDLIIADISKFGPDRVTRARTLGGVTGVPVMILTEMPSIELGDALTGLPTVDSVIFKPCANVAVLRALGRIQQRAAA